MLSGKKILIGITSGIAAYKTQTLVRLFVKAGAEVKVVLTPDAVEFVTPLTLSVLSQNPVHIYSFPEKSGLWDSHIDLGIWADAFIIAPLTANTMAKMAHGITDNLLLATYLACRCKVFVAPSMDVDMFNHITTQTNIQKLIEQNIEIINSKSGELASGLFGMGRMEEPEIIFEQIEKYFNKNLTLSDKKVLITSGPTVEAIDPVRCITNHSTGKMGYALAIEAANRGAEVTFISGPVDKYPDHKNINIINVNSASQMLEACKNNYSDKNILIFAAAVSDYTVENPSKEKIKKSENTINIELIKTKDIIKEIVPLLSDNQITVGFALETENELENAKSKLNSKNLDFIVLNSLKDKGAGFATNTNKVTLISKNNIIKSFDTKTKSEVAIDIFNFIYENH